LVISPSLYVTDIGETSANYADRVVFLYPGGFILAKAVEKSNLHERFALNILKVFGTDPKYIVMGFMA
jgi:sodium-dependent dicarboxylate transporter 2/3/5